MQTIIITIRVMDNFVNRTSLAVMLLASLSIHLLILFGQQAHRVHSGKIGIPAELSLSNFSSVQLAPSSKSTNDIQPKAQAKQVSSQITKPTQPVRPEVKRQGRGLIDKKSQPTADKRLNTAKDTIKKPDPVKKTAAKQEQTTKPSVEKALAKSTTSTIASGAQSGQLGSKSTPIVNTAPKFKTRPVAPIYPDSARRFGREGEVIMSIILNDKGDKTSISIVHSSGYRSLDRAALAAVKKWQFVAYIKNGRPVASQVTIPIRFSLGN
ncbi:energy transducer TonB [Vibrio sp. S4M6]|uniref:energy transducer TonB n=1 Tax=Vibrio sinus TaxID=2946865 RepID=UPI00202A47D3|nr:energy transducer TonB [Vibrio sinus]MCL9780930.1 energy transducer TonB [Vibrio sinus]